MELIDAFVLLQKVAHNIGGILFFVDSDNRADLAPKHPVKFITTDHVLTYTQHSLQLKLVNSYNKEPPRSIATRMSGLSLGKML